MGLAENLRRIRQEKGISQYKLARMAGVSRSAINSCEHGFSTMSKKLIAKLAEVLEVTVEELGDHPLVSRKKTYSKKPKVHNNNKKIEITLQEGKVKPCFNQKCLLNKNCFCQSPVVVNELAGCENQHKITEQGDKQSLLRAFRSRQGNYHKESDNLG